MILQEQNREQVKMFTSLEDLVSKDNPVRLIDYIVNTIMTIRLTNHRFKGESTTGRPAYSAETMLKLFIYGCMNRINSSRRLEAESLRNIELMWLLGDLSPDFKTISNFRKDNQELVNSFNKEVKLLIKQLELADGITLATDGTKLKANASREMLGKQEIAKRILMIDKEIEQYFQQISEEDERDLSAEMTIQKLQAERAEQELIIEKLRKEKSLLGTALERLESSKGRNYINLTDMDCSKLKSREGKIPGYNVQVISDTKHGFIVGEDVTTEANDIHQLKHMVELATDEMETKPETVVADTGYCRLDDIQELEVHGTNCYVPPQREQINNAEITFEYDEKNDRYTCSEGRNLTLRTKNKKYKGSLVNVYAGKECKGCALMEQCCRSKVGRHIVRYWNQDYRQTHRQKMATTKAIDMSIVRKSTIERVFGTMKLWLGKIPLVTRGIANVLTEIKIFAVSYNIKRLMNMFSFDELKSMIARILGINSPKMPSNSFIIEFTALFALIFAVKSISQYAIA